MKNKGLYYGIRDGQIVHISQVERGLNCNCYCPNCKDALVAHKGSIAHHFQHHCGIDRKGCYESSIHLAAKELFFKKMKVITPPLYGYVPEYRKILEGKVLKIIKVEKELDLNVFQPDLYLETRVKNNLSSDIIIFPLFVEIAVTHFVDDKKLRKIQDYGVSAIEISLKKLARDVNDEILWTEMTKHKNIKWLYNSQQKILEEKKNADLKKMREDKEKEEKEKEVNNRLFKKKYWNAGFEILKTYYRGTEYFDFDYKVYYFNVYCPQKNGQEISQEACGDCIFNHGKFKDLDDNIYKIICGFKIRKIKE